MYKCFVPSVYEEKLINSCTAILVKQGGKEADRCDSVNLLETRIESGKTSL